MKKLIIIAAICLSACSEDDPTKDPFIGTWQYTGADFTASFDLVADPNEVYALQNTKVNGEQWESIAVNEAVKGKSILSLGFRKPNTQAITVGFYKLRVSSDNNTMTADSVFQTSNDLEYKFTANQTLTRK